MHKECKYCFNRWRQIRTRYGLTREDYLEILREQSGVCAICLGHTTDGQKLSVDHDHVTGEIRGLLCDACNHMLGNARDNAETLAAGIEYLERHSA